MIIIVVCMASVLIPYRFYGVDSVFYIVSSIIGFLVSYYAYRLYDITGKKSHLYFYLSFVLLSMGLLTIGLASAYGYINFFEHGQPSGQQTIIDTVVFVDDFGYWIYYIVSLVAYGLLSYSYLPDKTKAGLTPIMIPMWYTGFPYFNILSFFLLSYAIFNAIVNYTSKKNLNSFLVMAAFSLIGLYHLLLFFTSFDKIIYVAAHLSLILGFLSLLAMLMRVSRKGG